MKKKKKRRRHRDREKGHGKTEVELGSMRPQAKELQLLPKAGRSKEAPSPQAFRGNLVLLTP